MPEARCHPWCGASPKPGGAWHDETIPSTAIKVWRSTTLIAVAAGPGKGLFGDAVGAAVVRGSAGGDGVQLRSNGSYLIPRTEDWISYRVKSTGFHCRLDKRVPGTMEPIAPIAPVLRELVEAQGWEVARLGFYIIHAGGPRILDDLSKFLKIDPYAFRYSRATLTEYGNIASAVVLDSLGRCFDDGGTKLGSGGLIAGFGPGITAEMATGIWTVVPDRTVALAGAGVR